MTGLAVHPVLAEHESFAHMPLGRKAVVHDSRTLMLANYLDLEALPANPSAFDLAAAVATWPMYGNDRKGDCTWAAVGHMIECWSFNAGGDVLPLDADIEEGYWLTGSPPSKTGQAGGPTDDGRNELDVLNFWRKTGVPNHPDKLRAFVSIDPTNHDLVKTSVYLFGGAYTGVALPLSAQTQQVWDVVGDGQTGRSAPGSWGGHAVDFVGYDAEGVIAVTWGDLIKITWRFVDAYFEEAYAGLSADWLSAKGTDMHGFNMAALDADIAAIGGPPAPPDPNPAPAAAATVKSETLQWQAVYGATSYDLVVNGVKHGSTRTALTAKFVLQSGDKVDIVAQPSGTKQSVSVTWR